MILTCPNCATRFFADDRAIGVGGRRVKCDACGKVWSGRPPPSAQAASEPTAVITAKPSRDITAPQIDENLQAPETAAPLFVERSAAGREAKRKAAGRPWLLSLVALLFLVIAGGVVFQPAIERAFPALTTFYHALGLKSAGA